MASVEAVIEELEKMPEKIRDYGEQAVKGSIMSHGHVDTGNMLNNTRAFAHGTDVQIIVWTRYASMVNDGHGPSVPHHTTAHGGSGWLQFKASPKWSPIFTRYASGYGGSGFFDEAYEKILAYVKTL